jgi:hypothetical protein
MIERAIQPHLLIAKLQQISELEYGLFTVA